MGHSQSTGAGPILRSCAVEALAHLAQAEGLYARYDDHRGLGTVHVDRGLLYLDSGDLDAAAAEGATAFRLGEDKQDYHSGSTEPASFNRGWKIPNSRSRWKTNPT